MTILLTNSIQKEAPLTSLLLFKSLEKKLDKLPLPDNSKTQSKNLSRSPKTASQVTPDIKEVLWDPTKNKINSWSKTIVSTIK